MSMTVGIMSTEHARLLRRLREDIEYLIMNTPTGPLRDLFTDVNIKLLQIQDTTVVTSFKGPTQHVKQQ